MNILAEKLESGESGLCLFSLTPPRLDTTDEKLERINARRSRRLETISPDGIMIYDVQDEKDRTDAPRAFDYHPYMNAFQYADRLQARSSFPQIRFAALSSYSAEGLFSLFGNNPGRPLVVVGYPGQVPRDRVNIGDAYKLHRQGGYNFPLGGIAIAERHLTLRDEAAAMVSKIKQGVSFFTSQCIYNPELAVNLLRDYRHQCDLENVRCRTVVLTFSPVLDGNDFGFLEWLGISLRDSFKAGFAYAADKKEYVTGYLLRIIGFLSAVCEELKIPWAINIESIIARKAETDLAAELAAMVTGRSLAVGQPGLSEYQGSSV